MSEKKATCRLYKVSLMLLGLRYYVSKLSKRLQYFLGKVLVLLAKASKSKNFSKTEISLRDLCDFSLIALNASIQPNDKVSSPQRASLFNLDYLATCRRSN